MKTKWKILITLALFLLFFFIVLAGVLFFVNIRNLEIPIGQNIAVIPIKGEITNDACSCNIFGCEQCANTKKIKELLDAADNDMTVRAIVLDINSGGGGVIASTEMMNAIKKTKKPVVARISDIGASGAYLVASAADKIIADKNSITGSIGTVMYIPHYYGLMEKLGINMTVIKSSKSKDIGSPYRPMTNSEKEELESLVNKVFENFIFEIAENRNLSFEYVKSIADGSIYLGEEAKKLGLIDEVGNMDDAIRIAQELAGIKGKANVKEISKRKTIFDLFSIEE